MASKLATKVVTHPNPRISQEDALSSLYDHPTFPEGGKVKSIKRVAGRWEAKIEFEKTASPPPFMDKKEDGPSDEGPAEPEESPLDDVVEDEADDKLDKKDEGPSEDAEKIDIQQVFELVKAIADKVGVSPHGDGEEEHELGPHAEGPPGLDGPPAPHGAPPAGPPAGKPPVKPPLRPGMAPGGSTPVGAPSFASVEEKLANGVRHFTVKETTAASLEDCKKQIETRYAPHGFKVAQIVEDEDTLQDDGSRRVRALVKK